MDCLHLKRRRWITFYKHRNALWNIYACIYLIYYKWLDSEFLKLFTQAAHTCVSKWYDHIQMNAFLQKSIWSHVHIYAVNNFLICRIWRTFVSLMFLNYSSTSYSASKANSLPHHYHGLGNRHKQLIIIQMMKRSFKKRLKRFSLLQNFLFPTKIKQVRKYRKTQLILWYEWNYGMSICNNLHIVRTCNANNKFHLFLSLRDAFTLIQVSNSS